MSLEPLIFDCRGDALLGIMHRAAHDAARGAVIVVGGPQYRVGSHRQFYHMANALQQSGVTTLRFDYRGMGDSEGDLRQFEEIDDDIRAAIDALCTQAPTIKEVLLVGLCDAASAILMYAAHDKRVGGIVIMNPWARAEDTLARSTVKHYYARRVLSREFWRKVLTGKLAWRESFGSFGRTLRKAMGQGDAAAGTPREPFRSRMLQGAQAFRGQVLLVTSGNDITAAEFSDHVGAQPAWRQVLARDTVVTRTLEQADHTFSSDEWRSTVNRQMQEWLETW